MGRRVQPSRTQGVSAIEKKGDAQFIMVLSPQIVCTAVNFITSRQLPLRRPFLIPRKQWRILHDENRSHDRPPEARFFESCVSDFLLTSSPFALTLAPE